MADVFCGLPGSQFMPPLSLGWSGEADITGSVQYVTSFKNTHIFKDVGRAIKFHKKAATILLRRKQRHSACLHAYTLTIIDPVKFLEEQQLHTQTHTHTLNQYPRPAVWREVNTARPLLLLLPPCGLYRACLTSPTYTLSHTHTHTRSTESLK